MNRLSSPVVDGSTIAPAPWKLRADGYVFMVKLPLPRGRAELFAPTELAEARFGQFGWVIYVEYNASPVGPYHELLFVPGTFRFGPRRLPSVTKTYLSSRSAMHSGQHNWGIPAEHGDFEVQDGRDGIKRITLRVAGRIAVELWLRHGTLALPVTSGIIPTNLRTLGQIMDGRTYLVSPTGHGLLQRAKVVHAWSEPGMFADLAADRVLTAARFSKFELTFPKPTIT